MRKVLALLVIGTIAVAGPASANHPGYLDTPFDSRGACEVQRNALSNEDDWLAEDFPQLFSSIGEVRSFLNRAFPCELNDGQWYITDHRIEVLESDWFLRRQ
ncbi:hypothetical protein LZ496_05665 [Sphingomonas sp. NSE70-1]|uniref:YARHG domain-containing protein n=1 Tax=Sphingomonas caseinilyticus TaxID=2908205 RepID=A0ABT0RTE7_9SPHN|nr:hypothetical protein [Sphingomonas caseinilyticus]MCL6698268.1 hypothetical protein [Sphingomonas caseinilyticus]